MPTVLRAGIYRFFFFSNKRNEPPHIHVESGDDYAKFWLYPVQLAKSVGYNSKELNAIRQLVLENTGLFEEKWHEYFER
jgi:hypothetical protein